jgi:hypothetical protein
MQISPTPGPWPSSSDPYLAFLPKVAQKNIIEPPNYLVAGTHFSGVFVRNASGTANGGTKMHHHKPYARAVRIVESAISNIVGVLHTCPPKNIIEPPDYLVI